MAISPADFFETMLGNAQRKFGSNCYRGSDHYIQQFGVPLPSLSLQYMFGVENLPYGRFYGFRGKTESYKSSMVFLLLRTIQDAGGLTALVETEHKASDTLMAGIMREAIELLQLCNASSLEMAQEQITNVLTNIKKLAPERHIAYGIGWDSLRGVLSEATSKKISQEGHYEKGFSAEAHALSPYFAKLVEELAFWPILLLFVQHEKKTLVEGYGGGGGSSALGGDAPGFHATTLIRSRVLKPVVEGALNPYATLEYRTIKNNLGVKGRKCVVDLYFNQEYDEEAHMNRHKYWFNWDRADLDCILGEKMENKAAIKEVLDVEEHSTNKGYFRSDTLGLKKATASEVMELLKSEENKELYDELRRQMRITKNLRFDQVEWTKVGGTDKSPLMGWAVREGVDLSGIQATASAEEEKPEEEEDADGAKK